MALNAETEARIEVSGRTASLSLTVGNGGSSNTLSGSRGFVAEPVSLKAGRQARAGFCQAGSIEILQQTDGSHILTDC